MGLESISDPDDVAADMDMDDDEDGLKVPDDDDEDERFYDTRSTSASVSSRSAGGERGKSEEVDTEEDPVDPITPGPATTRFNVSTDAKDTDDIEDDWVAPSVPTSPLLTPQPTQHYEVEVEGVPAVVPRMAKSRSNGSSSSSGKKKKTKKKEQQPVPVPKIRVPSPPSKESYPFPASDDGTLDWSGSSSTSSGGFEPPAADSFERRMHTARARDGGRTQSGGVKGILTDEWTEPHSERAG